MADTDEAFFARSATIINAANAQMDGASRERVAASLLFSAARFGAWTCMYENTSSETMAANREAMIDRVADSFRRAFEAQYDDYMNNYRQIMFGDLPQG